MRILCVVNDWPWPVRSGFSIRMKHILRALGELGTVDVVVRSCRPNKLPETAPPSAPWLGRVHFAERASRPQALRRFHWYTGKLPRSLLQEKWGAPQLTEGAWGESYDLVWFGHLEPYLAMGHAFAGTPRIVDIDNLEDFSLRHQVAVAPWEAEPERHPIVDRLRLVRREAMNRIDARRFAALHTRVAAEVEAVTICSDLDRKRLSVENCIVVPNAYEVASEENIASESTFALQSSDRSGEPIVTMVGLFRYPPNTDGATCLVEGVLPLLRDKFPDAQVRLVGRLDGRLGSLAGHPGVVMREEVADTSDELRIADVAAVPIRFGGGTRIKVIEAFAHRVPVVATTVGIEGLDVEPGQHVLTADDARSFADACIRLLDDPPLRERMTAAAYRRWNERYRWEYVRDAVGAVVDHALSR
jgi:glycosyltransferase involved in cell wall biosynthesis